MERYAAGKLINEGLLVTYGRTYFDQQGETLYCNWTASGIELLFFGTRLIAEFRADFGEEVEGLPWDKTAPRRKTWPWVAVFLDDDEAPTHVFEVSSDTQSHLIFESETPKNHRIKLIKRTENSKTYLGIKSIVAEGELLPILRPDRKRIEFVGDSITCGFGNGTLERDRAFYSAEEDGYLAYGARATRQLRMECSCVCISGITALRYEGWPVQLVSRELYAYCDKPHQEKTGRSPALLAWDFDRFHNDYVVLNLGTNDAFALLFSGTQNGDAFFEQGYVAFLKEIRRCNGEQTHIICSLGSMNYYLWHNIVRAVERYQTQTGDQYISYFKFNLMHPMDGYGAAGHPAMATHEKMAKELADYIQNLEAR